jgi:foldase protein PrsA
LAQGLDLNSEPGKSALTQVQHQVLEALIDQVIIEQEAKSLGLDVPAEVVEAKAQESIDQGPGQEQFAQWLAANQLTYDEFKETLRTQLVANQLFERIAAEVPESAEQIELRQILVSDEATARQIIAELKVGVDFAALAQSYSIDDSNRANGGSLGWFPRQAGLIPAEVEAIAFTLQPNEVSGPITSALGFHIIQLQAREVERPLSLELLQVLKQQHFTNWLMIRRTASVVERFITF